MSRKRYCILWFDKDGLADATEVNTVPEAESLIQQEFASSDPPVSAIVHRTKDWSIQSTYSNVAR